MVNTLRPRRNGQHFADDTLKRIFFNENLIKISLTFGPKGPIYNIQALVQIMAWRRPGDKPLYKPMMDSLPTHICITRPQWVKLGCRFTETMNKWVSHAPDTGAQLHDQGPISWIIFSIAIEIRWKFHSALIQFVVRRSLWNFAHGMTAVLSCHVQNFVVIWCPTLDLYYNQYPSIWRIVCEMGPGSWRSHTQPQESGSSLSMNRRGKETKLDQN